MRFMVRFVHREPQSDAVRALLPAERDRVREMKAEGTIENLYLATDGSNGWIAMQASTLAQLQTALKSLPLYAYLDFELAEIQ
jgi:muconolactone delta-isomerase